MNLVIKGVIAMDEIEKLYKNADIPKFGKRQCNDSEFIECQNYCFCSVDNKCDKFIIDYPPFTAEKQLKLIKWLAIKDYGKYTTSLLININSSYVRFSAGLQAGVHCLDVKYDKQSINFENSLAGLVNNLWQYLTEEEKQEIRGVLNG